MARESTWPWCTAREETWHGAGCAWVSQQHLPHSLGKSPLLVENLQSVHDEGGKYPEEVIEFFFAELLSVLLGFRHHLLSTSSLSDYSH